MQEGLKEEPVPESPQAAPSTPVKTHSGQRRSPKSATSTAQNKTTTENTEETVAKDTPEFQDDPSDADYTPSQYYFHYLF